MIKGGIGQCVGHVQFSFAKDEEQFLILVQFTNGGVNTESNNHLKFTLYKSSNKEDARKKFRKTLVRSQVNARLPLLLAHW